MRPFGRTGLTLPPIVFGTSCLGNLYRELPRTTKLAILREIFRCAPAPVVLDSAGKYGAGLALEVIGEALRTLGIDPSRVLISNKLGWLRVPLRSGEPSFEPGAWVGLEHDAVQALGYDGILRCAEQGAELLGSPYRPALVSVHDPDEYLARAHTPAERERALDEVLGAYRALGELKRHGAVRWIGVGAKDWRVVRELSQQVELDWVMLACSLTVLRHPPEVLEFVEALRRRGVGIVNSAVFHAGFLTGGEYFDYRRVDPDRRTDQPLFLWRERFFAICRRHEVLPAAACVAFALSPPGVTSVALNAAEPRQIEQNVALGSVEIPAAFWQDLQREGLVRRDYPYLG